MSKFLQATNLTWSDSTATSVFSKLSGYTLWYWNYKWVKGILSTKIVIFFIPKIIVVFRTDLHKMKINTELCCKRYDFLTKKTQNYRFQNYCPGWQYSNLFIWPSMWTRLEHAHCLETINNMWFLGKWESVNAWKKVDFDGFREKDE
jgi:hypothetical protein